MDQDPQVYVIRAHGGKYTDNFLKGRYAAIGWEELGDLSTVGTREELTERIKKEYKPTARQLGIGAGQVWTFYQEIRKGDFVITPGEGGLLYFGTVESDYYYQTQADDCPLRMRRKIAWTEKPLVRNQLSIPLQYTLKAWQTVFMVKDKISFLKEIGRKDLVISKPEVIEKEHFYHRVIERVLELSDSDFEILISEILRTLGFEAEKTGKPGDKGIDVEGRLDIYGLAYIDLKIQAKRYQRTASIAAAEIRAFRGSLPEKSQGAFLTTSDFQKKAYDEAVKAGFKPIGLINGEQLVDILVEKYDFLPDEIKEKLRLKRALIPE